MALLDEIRSRREEILKLAEDCGLKDIRVFGSVARGEESAESDIDLLVSYTKNSQKGLAVFGFPVKIETMLGRKVDMVFENGVYHHLKDRILTEAKPI